MRRIALFLFGLVLCGAAAAAGFPQASSLQQSTLQLRSDVAALRTALTKAGVNPQAILTSHVPALLERARAARAQAAAYKQEIEASQQSAESKRLAALMDYYFQNLDGTIQQVPSAGQQTPEVVRRLDEITQRIDELMPKLQALVAGACTLPHASTTIVKSSCAIAVCENGWVNADGSAANGCELPMR